MSVKSFIKVAYRYGELESNVKKVLKTGWLNQEDAALLSSQFEEMKVIYKQVEGVFEEETSMQLHQRMKLVPMKGTFMKKERYMPLFEEWKNSLGELDVKAINPELAKAKELLDSGVITEEEYTLIKEGIKS